MVQVTAAPYRYIIDTSSMLSQKDNEPHRRKIFRSQWEKIDELVERQEIVTCSETALEVNDEVVKTWLRDHQCVILQIDDEVQTNVTRVVTQNPQLIDFRSCKSSGDAFLIATAMKYGLTVITEENKTSNKKIPFVCSQMGVPCMSILELCEHEGWVF